MKEGNEGMKEIKERQREKEKRKKEKRKGNE